MERGLASDTDLATAAMAGDVGALATLLERHRASLHAVASRMLGNRTDAYDAVQDTSVVALMRLGDVHDPAAAVGWLHAVLRNTCLMQLRRRREVATGEVEPAQRYASPEEALEQQLMRDDVWVAIGDLSDDERTTVLLRYFSRCPSYDAIAALTSVPVGTVRSRLNRARDRLAAQLAMGTAGTTTRRATAEAEWRSRWTEFYRALHEEPRPSTYRDIYTNDVDVADTTGRWVGLDSWSTHEREALQLGVQARLVDVLSGPDLSIVEIDFTNPGSAPDHCPRHATFVHHLADGRSRRLRIHYPTSS